jgi:hypothetical protein
MKRSLLSALISTICLFFASISGYAQKIDSMINTYGERYPQEKIYIHFDKPAYNSGETIYFKAYLFAGIGPSGVSKNFYTQILDLNGKVLQQKLLPIFEGTSAGSFDLPANTPANVIFRAYTTWMLNFDTAFVYTKNIQVLNKSGVAATTPAGKPGAANTAATAKPTIQPVAVTSLKLFPEGGDLVTGLESIVAFKAVDPYGMPVSVQGVVKDNAGTVVTSFISTHDGMGRFALEPEAGKTYYAEWQDEKKQSYKTPLPAAKPLGVVIRTIQQDNRESFIVRRSTEAPDNLKTLYILGYFNQQVIYKARLNMQESFMTSGLIPLQGLPTGILQMTLFDANWNALAERIAFVNKEDFFFSSRVTPVTKDLKKRGKNVVVVEVPDTLKSNLSIAITDAGVSKMDPDGENIVSRLMLSGDLKGYVHNPYYYFTGNDDTVRSHLDLVMLTNGWRRFKWEDLAAGKLPTLKYPRENYLSLKADLTGVLPSQVPKNAQMNIFLEAKDSSRQLFMLQADSLGRFNEEGLIFFDTVKVFYQFNKDKRLADRAAVNFSNGTWKGYNAIKPDSTWKAPVLLDTSIVNRGRYFAAEAERIKPELDKKVKVLDVVTVKARTKTKQQQMDERYTSGLFSGGDATTFDLLNDPMATSSFNIFQFLQGRVAGLQITTGGAGGGTQLAWRGGTPTVFLNEMQVDVNTIENIPVSDVAYVKVFRPPFFGAAGGGSGGAIAIYTKKGGEVSVNDNNQNTGLAKGILVGYSAPREFYSPDYSKESPLHEVPDVRTTLFWAPYILTDAANRRTTIQFYNNDVSTRLRVVMEGMNEEGRLTRVEKIIE